MTIPSATMESANPSAVGQLPFFLRLLIGFAGEEAGQLVMALAGFGSEGMARSALLLGGSATIITLVGFHLVASPRLRSRTIGKREIRISSLRRRNE